MATKGYNLEQTGEQVQAALNKAINLGPATEEADGLMTAADKASLENLNTEINDKVDKVTGKGLSTNDFTNEDKSKLDTAYQVPSTGIPAADMSSGVQTALNKANSAVQPADLVPITEKIPAQASAQNQLADKAFVNSSISTASADFKGTYDSLAELQAVTADKNDYGYVVSTDEAGNTVYSRYKYNGSSWVFEYDLNNSSFTAAEWAAIQSGITAPLVQKLGALPTNADLQSALSGKQATLVSGTNIKTVDGQSILGSGNLSVSDPNAVKVTAQTWTDAQKTQARTNIGAYAKPSGGIPKTDLASCVQGSLDLADSAIQARPSGEVDPTITPAEYATQEELAQLEAKIDVPTTTALDFSFNGYIKTDGSFTGTNNFKATDYVAVRPGDIVVYTLAQGASLPTIAAYDSDKTFLQALAWGTNSFQTDATLTIPTSPAGIAFIRVSGRSINHDTHPQANPSGTITTFDKAIHESQLDAYKAEVDGKFDLVDEYGVYSGSNGYIRKDTMTFSTSNNYRVSPLIPIYPGFVIEHNGTFNAPYSTVCNAFFGADAVLPTDKPMAVASFTGGKMTVTQADWDAGYRFVAISYDINSTPSPSATVSRTISQDMARTDALVEELNNDTIGITRSSATVFNVIVPTGNGNAVRFPFERISKTWSTLTYQDADGNTQTISNFKSADVWNNFNVYDAKTGDYLCQGNSNFIYKATDEENHAGNGHGCEVMDYFVSLIDGIEVTPTDSPTSYRCKEFRLIWRSKVFKSNGTGNTHSTTYPFFDTSGNPIVTAEHYIDITFRPGEPVKIINQLVIKRDGVQFEQCHGAMLECNYGDFSKVICNDSNADYNSVSDSGVFTAVGDSVVLSNTTKKCNDVTMFGKGFYVRQKMVAVKANPENLVVRFTYYEDRLKCYFMPVICTTYSSDAGLSPAQTFNTGDIIKVEDEREIVIF